MTLEIGPNLLNALNRVSLAAVIIGIVRGALAWNSLRRIQR